MIKDRLIIFTDMHGCYQEFETLIKRVGVTCDDFAVVLGDGFDRHGKDSAQKVYELIRDYEMKYIFGNHDSELFSKIRDNKPIHKPWYRDWWESFKPEARTWFLNIGLEKEKIVPCKGAFFYKQTPFYIKINGLVGDPGILLVHAGINPHLSLEKHDPRTLCTIQCVSKLGIGGSFRYERLAKGNVNQAYYWTNTLKDALPEYDNTHIIYGHSSKKVGEHEVEVKERNIKATCLDFGCVHGHQLGCLVIDNKTKETRLETVQAPKDYYRESYHSERK